MLKQLNQGWLGVFYDYGADQDFPINLSILGYRTLVDVGDQTPAAYAASLPASVRPTASLQQASCFTPDSLTQAGT